MAAVQTLARPYAKAIFELAQQAQALESWRETLVWLARAIAMPDIAATLKDPLFDREKKVALVAKALDSEDADVLRMVRVLAENERLHLAPAILSLYEDYQAAFLREVKVEILSTFALDAQQTELLTSALEKKLARRISLVTRVDPDILGGAIITIDDLVIDGSGRGALATLESYLKGTQLCS